MYVFHLLINYFAQEWRDEFLTWEPSDYDGLIDFRYAQDNVWKPDITFFNS